MGFALSTEQNQTKNGALLSTNVDQEVSRRRKNMKKMMLQLFVIGAMIATYALPLLAHGGGGP
jgi:hypothetical protein